MHLPLLIMFAGTAYAHGLRYAKGDYVIIMDADLSHHVSNIAYWLVLLLRCAMETEETDAYACHAAQVHT